MLNVKDNKTMMYTDLAVEIQEECSGRQGEIPGVVLEQYKEDGKGIRVTKIQIQTADGAKRMGRPIGNYMTLESADKEHSDKNLSGTKLPDTNLLASYINELLPSSAHSFLIVGLGNANMTADALGPLTIEKMAQSGKYDAILCLGAVIKGSTDHYDYVCAEVSKGIAMVGMETGVPTMFGVLTTDNIEQAIERAGTKAGNKGFDVACSAIEMANLNRML